jgi:hypothetical protein
MFEYHHLPVLKMKVILLKSWTNSIGIKYPIGTVIPFWDGFAKELIRDGVGRKYDGEYPPQKKAKINLNTK